MHNLNLVEADDIPKTLLNPHRRRRHLQARIGEVLDEVRGSVEDVRLAIAAPVNAPQRAVRPALLRAKLLPASRAAIDDDRFYDSILGRRMVRIAQLRNAGIYPYLAFDDGTLRSPGLWLEQPDSWHDEVDDRGGWQIRIIE